MKDIKTIGNLTFEEKKIPFNASKNFSEPLSVPDEWIHVSITDKKEEELNNFLGENYNEFKKNIIVNELKNDNDIILLYNEKIKL